MKPRLENAAVSAFLAAGQRKIAGAPREAQATSGLSGKSHFRNQ